MVKHTFIPSPYEAIMLTVISLFALGLFTLAPIIRSINSSLGATSYHFFSDSIGAFFSSNLAKLNTPRVTTILTFVLWALVGALAYVLVWAVAGLFRTIGEDVSPFHNMVLPHGYQANMNAFDRTARIIIRVLAVMALFFWIGIFFSKVLPLSVNQFVSSLTKFDALSIIGIFLSVLYMIAALFSFVVIWRLILMRRRVFNSSL